MLSYKYYNFFNLATVTEKIVYFILFLYYQPFQVWSSYCQVYTNKSYWWCKPAQ